MKSLFFTIVFFLSLKILSAQDDKSRLECMQGVWGNIMNSDQEKAFSIIKDKSSLNFVYNISRGLDFPLTESIKGFYSGDIEVDSLNIDSLSANGLHYIVIDKNDVSSSGWVQAPYYLTPDYFECDGELMSINGGQLVEYSKIEQLPFEALTKLYYRGLIDKKDYIKVYLNLKVLAIKSVKCVLYSEPGKPTKARLKKDDVVIVLDEVGKWLKIKYSKSEIGWIRKEDAN